MAHALETFFAFPAEAAQSADLARRSLGRRLLDAVYGYQMRRVERALRFHGYVPETPSVHGGLRRIGLSRAGALPFNR